MALAFLFDLDGVIVDSMPFHTAVWREYLAQHQIEAAHLLDHMHGARNDALVRALFGPHLGEEEVFAHGAAKEALFRQRLNPAEHLVPGVVDFLHLHAAVPKAVGSNAEKANIDHVLQGAGLQHHFQTIVDGSQVERAKPQPDIYLKAAGRLGLRPQQCIVFEDSPTGVAAGQAAGMRVVGVNTANLAEFPAVDLVIRDFLSPEPSVMAPDATAWYAVILLAGAAILWVWRAGQGQLDREREQSEGVQRTTARVLQSKSLREIDEQLRRGLGDMRRKIEVQSYFYRRATRELETLEGNAVDIHSPQAGAPSIIATTFRNRVAVYTTETRPPGYLVPMLAGEEATGVILFSGPDLRTLELSALQHLATGAAVAVRTLDQQAVQEQMFRHEKLATATQFVHAVAMELREVAEESPRAQDLVERLLAMGRAEADAGPLPLAAHLNRLFAARRARWADYQIEAPEDLPDHPALQVLASEPQLEQVFTALFETAEMLRPPALEVTASTRGRRARIEIRFSPVLPGPPIADARRGLIQAALRAMAGELIVVEALPVRFEVDLPLSVPTSPLHEPREARTALVVEQDATQRWQLVQLIAQRGVRAVPAETPGDALDRFSQFDFDLVFCPWQNGRPESMRLIEHVLLADRPVQAFVVAEEEENGAEAALEGRALVLRKPIRDSSLFPLLPSA